MENKNKVHPMLILLAVLLSISLILNACVAPRVKASDTPLPSIDYCKDFLISGISSNVNNAVAISNLINDGEISSSDKDAIAVYALQSITLLNMCQGYHLPADIILQSREMVLLTIDAINWENIDWGSETMQTVGGTTGFYKVYGGDDTLYICNIYSTGANPAIVCMSDHFEITYSISYTENGFSFPDNFGTCSPYYSDTNTPGYIEAGMTFTKGSFYPNWFYYTGYDSKGFFSTIKGWTRCVEGGVYNQRVACASTVPVLVSGSSIPYSVCGNGLSYDMPVNVTYNNSEPWNYFNNTLNPYISNNYPGYDDFLLFPDGYNPDNGGGGGTNNNIDIPVFSPILTPIDINGVAVIGAAAGSVIMGGININLPVNGVVEIGGIPFELPLDDYEIDGHTIDFPDSTHFTFDNMPITINPDGSLTIDGTNYEFPIGQYETYPVENNQYVYTVEMPTMETIEVNQVSFNAPDLSAVADGVSWWWDSIYIVLNDTGILALLPIIFGIGLLAYSLYKIGG